MDWKNRETKKKDKSNSMWSARNEEKVVLKCTCISWKYVVCYGSMDEGLG